MTPIINLTTSIQNTLNDSWVCFRILTFYLQVYGRHRVFSSSLAKWFPFTYAYVFARSSIRTEYSVFGIVQSHVDVNNDCLQDTPWGQCDGLLSSFCTCPRGILTRSSVQKNLNETAKQKMHKCNPQERYNYPGVYALHVITDLVILLSTVEWKRATVHHVSAQQVIMMSVGTTIKSRRAWCATWSAWAGNSHCVEFIRVCAISGLENLLLARTQSSP